MYNLQRFFVLSLPMRIYLKVIRKNLRILRILRILCKHPKSAVFLFHNQTLIFALKKVCSV